jgi:hypothetical protein
MLKSKPESEALWRALTRRIEEQASHDGMGGIVALFRDSLRPLSPLLAQLLWVAQPTMSLFGESDSTASLALLLETDGDPEPILSQGTPPSEGT